MSDDDFRLGLQRGHNPLKEKAREIFQPSQPVKTPELLFGRDRERTQALDALETPGQTLFIYGERGVGKTSLAITAATMFNSSDCEPVYYSCHPDLSFRRLVSQIARKLLDLPIYRKPKKRILEASLSTSVGKLAHRVESGEGELPELVDTNDAVDLFSEIAKRSPARRAVVIIDEIDVVREESVRRDLAYLVKQLGDRDCPVKFIYVGIADTIDELLTHHESASRYIAAIMLPRLHLGVLKAMAKTGFETLGIEVNDPMLWRIAYISDGFAHFTHLICLKTALRLLDECSPPRRLTAQAIEGGLRDAIDASEVWLRQAYEDATKKYKDDYERVLWAAADHWEIERNTGHMFPCYERICADMGKEALPRHKFSLKLNALKRPEHGRALISNRSSWYKFRLTMLRGYCRMKAEARGVSVGLDYLENRAPALVGATKASGGDKPNG